MPQRRVRRWIGRRHRRLKDWGRVGW
jgi:hypothetical protein